MNRTIIEKDFEEALRTESFTVHNDFIKKLLDWKGDTIQLLGHLHWNFKGFNK